MKENTFTTTAKATNETYDVVFFIPSFIWNLNNVCSHVCICVWDCLFNMSIRCIACIVPCMCDRVVYLEALLHTHTHRRTSYGWIFVFRGSFNLTFNYFHGMHHASFKWCVRSCIYHLFAVFSFFVFLFLLCLLHILILPTILLLQKFGLSSSNDNIYHMRTIFQELDRLHLKNFNHSQRFFLLTLKRKQWYW